MGCKTVSINSSGQLGQQYDAEVALLIMLNVHI